MENARPATADDIPQVALLARMMVAELAPMKGGGLFVRREVRPEPFEATYADLLERSDVAVIVGCIDAAVLAFGVIVREELRDGEVLADITDLFTDPDARDVGVGECVLDALLAVSDAWGSIGIDATALPGHRAAKNFFETAGFTARRIVMHRSVERNP